MRWLRVFWCRRCVHAWYVLEREAYRRGCAAYDRLVAAEAS